ncbi:MAG: helix-turn-helix transcriptional regulator [Thermoplasmata archaeon]|nr:helix-turn-helix transcriptional regulator [Thermoplasmata archaeon]MCI4337759.1 helix-turn-helix transcriptional regulator [Thermoplasmata archaeon]MCI4341389.1 helix-turn-helix transcriptional regulator [Thermoplasmata archaeon]
MAPPTQPPEHSHCDFEGTFRLLGEKYVLHILLALVQRSPRRFSDLQESLRANTATLTDRLRRMQSLGLVAREVIRVVPRRVEYRLTPMGRDLVKIFTPMMRWREKYSK